MEKSEEQGQGKLREAVARSLCEGSKGKERQGIHFRMEYYFYDAQSDCCRILR